MKRYPTATFIDNKDLFCNDLTTKPVSGMGRVLVTGASGYIGGRLIYELLARGYKVRAMVRSNADIYQRRWPLAEIVIADALNPRQLRFALEGVDAAYYLIHSLYRGLKDFASMDIEAADNFKTAAGEKHIKRIIYLGGLGDIADSLSDHLSSRIDVAIRLMMGNVPVTTLRAAVIIGSGSASYEIIKNLVKRLPVLLVPSWAKNRCQPIAIRDVIKYLVGVLEVSETAGKYFDIGGSDVLTYEDMLKILAKVINKKILFIPSPINSIAFYSYFAGIITPVPYALTRSLLEGLKNEVICKDSSIKKLVRFKPMSYKESLIRTMTREEQDKIYSRWTDAYPPAHALALKLHEVRDKNIYKAYHFIYTDKEPVRLFNSFCRIGGRSGWFRNNWMWRLRGMLDSLLMGVGTLRGRRSEQRLMVNDIIDFWRVEDIKRNKMLLLRAEMKLPGRAWLEFNIDETAGRRKLSVSAYYDTHTFSGRLYWYVFLPFHHYIFKKLIEDIERRS